MFVYSVFLTFCVSFRALGKIAASPRPERAASCRNESDCSTLPLLLVVSQTFMVVQTAYWSGSQQVKVSQDLSVFQSKKTSVSTRIQANWKPCPWAAAFKSGSVPFRGRLAEGCFCVLPLYFHLGDSH